MRRNSNNQYKKVLRRIFAYCIPYGWILLVIINSVPDKRSTHLTKQFSFAIFSGLPVKEKGQLEYNRKPIKIARHISQLLCTFFYANDAINIINDL